MANEISKTEELFCSELKISIPQIITRDDYCNCCNLVNLIMDITRNEKSSMLYNMMKSCRDFLDSLEFDPDVSESMYVGSTAARFGRAFYENVQRIDSIVNYKTANICRSEVPGRYLILPGSIINVNPKPSLPDSTLRILRESIKEGMVNEDTGEVLESITVKSLSAAESLVSGYLCNGSKLRSYVKLVW